MLPEKILFELKKIGKDPIQIENQITNFEAGFPFLKIIRPATNGDGIKKLNKGELEENSIYYDKQKSALTLLKFVPASGAASRMFKNLFEFRHQLEAGKNSDELLASKAYENANIFFKSIRHFAFFKELNKFLEDEGYNIENLIKAGKYKIILDYLLDEKGLNYGHLPKGLIKFHSYDDDTRTPLEEQLVDGMLYAKNADKKVYVHFTVAPPFLEEFELTASRATAKYGKRLGGEYNISFSVQKPETDNLAVDLDNMPFYDRGAKLVFRPGGHGALLDNLNDLKADIIFIKNIDNVVPDHHKDEVALYKKVLGGILLRYRDKIFEYLQLTENDISKQQLLEIQEFIHEKLNISLPPGFDKKMTGEKIEFIRDKLNRPTRVCGMVKNEGEPGGGPYWAVNHDGSHSLQIVESSQIDMQDPSQKNIFDAATHFNPVDIVCSVRNYKGESFNLLEFRDPDTGFISVKSHDGKKIKVQELPGLWNGSMANWNTIFVEVPVETFNPVKSVVDLLREKHQ